MYKIWIYDHYFLFLRFSLNPSEVGSKMEGVPIKDTMLSDMCPDIESAFCFPHKYRTINGECNNVKNPTWGITGAAYLRILQPMYQDGKQHNMQSHILRGGMLRENGGGKGSHHRFRRQCRFAAVQTIERFLLFEDLHCLICSSLGTAHRHTQLWLIDRKFLCDPRPNIYVQFYPLFEMSGTVIAG